MANNSIKTGTKVVWYDWKKRTIPRTLNSVHKVMTGIIVAQSRQSDECVIVEWDNPDFPVSIENVDDLIEIP